MIAAGVAIYSTPDLHETYESFVTRIFLAMSDARLKPRHPGDGVDLGKVSASDLECVGVEKAMNGPRNELTPRCEGPNGDKKAAGTGSGAPIPVAHQVCVAGTHGVKEELADSEGRRLRIGLGVIGVFDIRDVFGVVDRK